MFFETRVITLGTTHTHGQGKCFDTNTTNCMYLYVSFECA